MSTFTRVGYLCLQGYPARICSGCTSACCEPVFVEDDTPLVTNTGKGLTDADIEAYCAEAEGQVAKLLLDVGVIVV